ncbi:hypothetical protein FHS29_004318 [Saccharothrix tamanrassetensis]|uniref:Uncharacterized protein n=1 Tax=Saccharothrix tamanrassetensis TaxID=1051531 RepID=A0A841CLA5_9PSEU|nr:hypothetical protein [Saccharothrix tamanrassetensis]MBB5957723.1 hypothetical protein [Saccharothrix tamanrassetensis]
MGSLRSGGYRLRTRYLVAPPGLARSGYARSTTGGGSSRCARTTTKTTRGSTGTTRVGTYAFATDKTDGYDYAIAWTAAEQGFLAPGISERSVIGGDEPFGHYFDPDQPLGVESDCPE